MGSFFAIIYGIFYNAIDYFFNLISMKVLWLVAMVLAAVGAINWGLVGLFDFDLVAYLFVGYATVAKVVYVVVGVAGLYLLVSTLLCKCCSCCKGGESKCGDDCCCGK